jgi:hypothetical protein
MARVACRRPKPIADVLEALLLKVRTAAVAFDKVTWVE